MQKISSGEPLSAALIKAVNPQYRHAVRRYQAFIDNSGYDLMTGAKPYLDSLTVGASSYNQHLKAVKAAIRYAADHSDMTEAQRFKLEKHLAKLKARKQHGGIKKTDAVPTPEEVARLIETAPPRLSLMIRFLWESSCRISEALGAEHSNARQSGDIVYIRITGKGGKERTIKVTAGLYSAINQAFNGKRYLFENRGHAYNRTTATTQIRRHAEATIGKRTSAHMIRHARGTLISDRLGISKAAEELGHSDIRVTKRFYDHTEVSDDEYLNLLNIKEK
jgi:integrase